VNRIAPWKKDAILKKVIFWTVKQVLICDIK